jgi:hypothetical protein
MQSLVCSSERKELGIRDWGSGIGLEITPMLLGFYDDGSHQGSHPETAHLFAPFNPSATLQQAQYKQEKNRLGAHYSFVSTKFWANEQKFVNDFRQEMSWYSTIQNVIVKRECRANDRSSQNDFIPRESKKDAFWRPTIETWHA